MSTVARAQMIGGVFAVGDPGSTRLVFGAVALLVLVGLGLIATSFWLWRETRIDDPVLLPLERMGERDWQRADPVFQRRMLDEARPPGAAPLHDVAPVPIPDPDFERGPDPDGLDGIIGVGEPEELVRGADVSAEHVGEVANDDSTSHGSPSDGSPPGSDQVFESPPWPEAQAPADGAADPVVDPVVEPVVDPVVGAVSQVESAASGSETTAIPPPDLVDAPAVPLPSPDSSDDETFVDPGLGPLS